MVYRLLNARTKVSIQSINVEFFKENLSRPESIVIIEEEVQKIVKEPETDEESEDIYESAEELTEPKQEPEPEPKLGPRTRKMCKIPEATSSVGDTHILQRPIRAAKT